MNFKHFDFGTSEGGVQNVVSISDDGNILICRDIQSAAVNQVIIDECKKLKNLNSNGGPPGFGEGYIHAKIPVTIWQEWRRSWMMKFRQYMTWQTFEAMQINKREYSDFTCVDHKLHVPDNVRTTGR